MKISWSLKPSPFDSSPNFTPRNFFGLHYIKDRFESLNKIAELELWYLIYKLKVRLESWIDREIHLWGLIIQITIWTQFWNWANIYFELLLALVDVLNLNRSGIDCLRSPKYFFRYYRQYYGLRTSHDIEQFFSWMIILDLNRGMTWMSGSLKAQKYFLILLLTTNFYFS